jgi:RNA polymerase sigma-70 factor (ECF subfamily)
MSVFLTPQCEPSRPPLNHHPPPHQTPSGNRTPDGETESDHELITRVALGDAQAFTSLYLRHAPMVYLTIFRILRNAEITEDVRQEAFLRLWSQASTFQAEKGTLTAWLHRIARNLALDELRHQRCRPRPAPGDQTELLTQTIDGRQDVERQAIARLMGEHAMEGMKRLPPAQRQAVELAYLRELTHREVAAALNEPLGTIKSRISMGAAKIRADLIAPPPA